MKRQQRGFTLIELMVAVAIVGLLAASAIPNYREMQYRTKKTERNMVMSAIAKSLREVMANKDYNLPGGALTGSWIPALPVTPMKKTFDWTQPGWSMLTVSEFGNVYYHYYFTASSVPGNTYFLVQAEGDLDGNGQINVRTQQWNLQGSLWQLVTDTETGDTY